MRSNGRGSICILSILVLVTAFLPATGRADDTDTLAYVSGGSKGTVYRLDATSTTEIFSAKGGFRAEALDADGNGRLFICDSSSSEIHILEQDETGDWILTTIYDKSSASSPSPEQPVGCNVIGADLFFSERSGSGDERGLWTIRDAAVTPTSGSFQAPELIVSFRAVSGDEVSDLVITPDVKALMSLGSQILVAEPPDFAEFTTLIPDLGGQATGLAVNSVGEIFVAIGDLGIIEVYDAAGQRCGIFTDVAPLRPAGMEFDLADNLYFAAPGKSNGTGGDVFVASPNGGAATHQCGFNPPLVSSVPLNDDAPTAEVDVALPPSLSSLDLTFADDGALTAKQCSALFTLDPEFLNDLADPDCEITITCRQMPLEEFELRTEDYFADTTCMEIPNGNGNCIEMVVDGAECFGGVTEVEWIFFVLSTIDETDRPGLLFAKDAGPTQAYTENILTEFTGEVPDLPNDPALKAKKDRFGTGLVGVTGAPNRAPVADAGADQSVGCGTDTVTIDGSASFDLDPLDTSLTYAWTGPAIPPGAEDDPSFLVAVADLGLGDHEYTLTVTDSGLYSDDGPLSDTDTVTITVTVDGTLTTIHNLTVDPASLWPPDHTMIPVSVTVVASSDCGDVTCEITEVTSTDPTGAPDDPDSGNGANTYPDWLVTGPLTLDLRSERSEGGDSVDDTRIYTIEVSCTDEAGSTVADTVQVSVVSDQGN